MIIGAQILPNRASTKDEKRKEKSNNEISRRKIRINFKLELIFKTRFRLGKTDIESVCVNLSYVLNLKLMHLLKMKKRENKTGKDRGKNLLPVRWIAKLRKKSNTENSQSKYMVDYRWPKAHAQTKIIR